MTPNSPEVSAKTRPVESGMDSLGDKSDGKPHCRRAGAQCFVVAALVLAAASEVTAQSRGPRDNIDTGGLTVEAVTGWDGTVDQSMPVPVSLMLSNYSGRDIDGTLLLTNPFTGDRVILGELYVSQGSTRTFTSIQALPNWSECYVSLVESRQIIWRRELPVSTGKTFSLDTNFALFIEDSDRRLQLPQARSGESESGPWVHGDTGVAGSNGRRIDCLTAKPWQIPKHPGPLAAVQAIIFPEKVSVEILNTVQCEAVAQWMCQGGTVFVHRDSSALIDQLIEATPLDVTPESPSGGFGVRRSGLGAILEYSSPLLDPSSSEVRTQIAHVLATLPHQHAGSRINSVRMHNYEAGRADYNRLMVVAFFAVYTLFSGLIALLLFRSGRRTVATYTVTVVVAASIMSAIMGGVLRASQGDLRLVTLTCAGEGGIVQFGKIEVQSAGSRNTQVSIQGQHADLQLTEGHFGFRQHFLYNYGYQPTSPPFTWQPNLAKHTDDQYEISVPMTPWGTRQLAARAFRRQFPRLEFELEFEPDTAEAPAEDNSGDEVTSQVLLPSGRFTLRLNNRLPVRMMDCKLVIGASCTCAPSGNIVERQIVSAGGFRQMAASVSPSPDGLTDAYHIEDLSGIAAGRTVDRTFAASFRAKLYRWDMDLSFENARVAPPHIARLGTATAWIVARLDDSPILKIDEQRTEFVPHEKLHLFVQEIHPDNMPDAGGFLLPVPPTADKE